jgi:hypothetical protein
MQKKNAVKVSALSFLKKNFKGTSQTGERITGMTSKKMSAQAQFCPCSCHSPT